MDKVVKWKKEFGSRLLEARKLRSMPVGDIVQHMETNGIRRSFCRDTLNAWENGTTTPSFPDAILVCKRLRIRPEWLCNGEGPMEA